MSAYKRITCKIVDKATLLAALRELGLTPTVHEKPVPLRGFEGRKRQEKAEIVVPKAQLNEIFTGASNDLGFAWNEETHQYDMIASDYDLKRGEIETRILQAYAKAAIEEALRRKRISVKQDTEENNLADRERKTVVMVGKAFL